MLRLDISRLRVALQRLAETKSLIAADRVCIATTQGGPGFPDPTERVVHWEGSGLPWFLRPLDGIFVTRRLIEFSAPAGLLAIAAEADSYYQITVYSFTRSLLPAVISQVRSKRSDVAAVADQDATYAELNLDGDSPGEEGWVVFTRHNRDCPSDLVECLHHIDDLE